MHTTIHFARSPFAPLALSFFGLALGYVMETALFGIGWKAVAVPLAIRGVTALSTQADRAWVSQR